MRDSPRHRRLRSDQRALERLKSESGILDYMAYGTPAETYIVRYRGLGFWRPDPASHVAVRDLHEVRIGLGAAYPRMMPELSWQTPIFHPNISAAGIVCLGGYGTYWVPSLSLDELVEMLWDMIRYKNFDPNSPYNREAAAWVKLQNEYRLPIDDRPLRNLVASGLVPSHAGIGSPVSPRSNSPAMKLSPPAPPEVVFLDEVVEAELVESEEPKREDDVLIIE